MALVRYSYCKAFSCLPSLFFKNSTTIERIDPIVSKNKLVISAHINTDVLFSFFFVLNNDHRICLSVNFGGSINFRFDTTPPTTFLRTSEIDLNPLDF